MTEPVNKSVSITLTQVERELKQAGIEQEKSAVNALNQVVKAAQESVYVMRREMSLYTWLTAINIVMTILVVITSCVAALT